MQEPGNIPPYQAPIPPPSGDPGYAAAIPPAGSATVNFDVIGRAWEVLKPNIGIWIVAFLIYMAVSFGFSMIISMVTGGGGGGAPIPTGAPGEFQTSPAMPNVGLMFVGQIIQFIVTQFLMGGMYRMAINQVRTGTLSIGDIFSVTNVLPALLGAAILSALATGVGLVLCIVPGLLISGLLMFTVPLVVDAKLGPIEAMSTSYNALKSQMWMALAFVIVIGLLAGVGFLACGVGILVSGPLAILSMATLYRDFFPQVPQQSALV